MNIVFLRNLNELSEEKSNTENMKNTSEDNNETRKSSKTSKSTKIIDFPPLPLVTSPQKLSRKNFDKHKISTALLKVTSLYHECSFIFMTFRCT